ncbi:MAG: hypothetical protein R8M45_09595 [Ghiorsea sp.]
MSTNVTEFIGGLDSGILQQQLSKVLSDVAGAVIDHERQATVSLNFKMKRIGSNQVLLEHELKFKRPTSKGNTSEDMTTSTSMHVGLNGDLSLTPENQPDIFEHDKNVTSMKQGAV